MLHSDGALLLKRVRLPVLMSLGVCNITSPIPPLAYTYKAKQLAAIEVYRVDVTKIFVRRERGESCKGGLDMAK